MKVEWTTTAIEQLKEIYEYYKLEVSIQVAKKLRNRIVNRTASKINLIK